MMQGYGLSFHHFGLAVKAPDRAVHFTKALGYELGATLLDPTQNVNLIWCAHATMPAIEIIYPTETAGPIDAILQKSDSLVYHLCYECEDIERSISNMIAGGERVVTVASATPAPLFGGRNVAFLMIKGFGIVELLAASRK